MRQKSREARTQSAEESQPMRQTLTTAAADPPPGVNLFPASHWDARRHPLSYKARDYGDDRRNTPCNKSVTSF